MGYILPIPQYQYSQYRERVVNELGDSYSSIDPVERVSFKKILDNSSDASMASNDRTRAQLSKKKEYEAFQAHLAKISGKGIQINKYV
ncbi:hypothetical protein F9802_15775 [Bacillus aerolatus]|uniref:Uncharacterized protein n=1 Tax=Bacillus aerolatus TaxID=2653354 RepID=A0A6I1FHR1_9BACI|nr:hypothetical protein [Bacillus aerolatus]KAB7705017.1 hypothetical protein F9802_15775 [Bacillus aerolatus]